MTTSTKSRNTPAPAAAKRTSARQKAEAPEVVEAPKAKAPKVPSYRDAEGFVEALKSAASIAKGNVDLAQPIQLIRHLAWKTPGGVVGWSEGTTENVIAYAEEILVPEGTAIPEALKVALSLAEKAAEDKPQKDAVAVLAKVIKGHEA